MKQATVLALLSGLRGRRQSDRGERTLKGCAGNSFLFLGGIAGQGNAFPIQGYFKETFFIRFFS